jgi:hypothetical protein
MFQRKTLRKTKQVESTKLTKKKKKKTLVPLTIASKVGKFCSASRKWEISIFFFMGFDIIIVPYFEV